MNSNANFISFKTSGKYYTQGRGYVPPLAFNPIFCMEERRDVIVKANNGKMPGLNSPAKDLTVVAVIDDDVDYGWNLLLYPNDHELNNKNAT
jgi:hypothetical protein